MPTSTKFPFVRPSELKRIAVVCHRNTDPDSYLAAYALTKFLGKIAPDADVNVATPGGANILTKKLIELFPSKVAEDGTEYDLLVAVDVGDVELLDEWRDKMRNATGFKVLIDHHPEQVPSIYHKSVVDTTVSSTSEIVYTLFSESRVEIDRNTAAALLVGILFDSQHLRLAGEKTLRAVLGLIERGADLTYAKQLLNTRPDYSEIIANIKGSQRSRIYRINEFVVATSKIGSFQAGVARSLIGLGADVSLVVGNVEDETRLSLRATQRFSEATHIHLGVDVARPLSKELGGYGGGHPTAATFSTRTSEDEALEKTLGKLGSLLGSKPIEVE
jgi:nanoRNase/pAp phosphatase (c-di-AMP/oligoRNAs hydrolase)